MENPELTTEQFTEKKKEVEIDLMPLVSKFYAGKDEERPMPSPNMNSTYIPDTSPKVDEVD